ncbi:MAG: c-type cytochrome domain-containing protein, partial [Akkermansiaceae bacterium]
MPLPPRSIVVLLIAVLGLFSCQEKGTRASPPTPPPPQVSYNFEIRPILAQKCFGCHGRNHNANESGLRLDTAEFAFAPLSEGDPAPNRHAFLPGNREQSVAWLRIHSEDPEKLMPPPDSRIPLTEDEKDLLGRWIDQGAKYEPHWAFQTLPAEVPVPAVSASGWPAGKIDRFVLATDRAQAGLPVGREHVDPVEQHQGLALFALDARPMAERVVHRPSGHHGQRLGDVHVLAHLVRRGRAVLLVDAGLDALAAKR